MSLNGGWVMKQSKLECQKAVLLQPRYFFLNYLRICYKSLINFQKSGKVDSGSSFIAFAEGYVSGEFFLCHLPLMSLLN